MTGSAFHKAMAQDAVRLSQMTGTKGWVAGLSKALQVAGYAFQPQHLHNIDIGQLQSLLRGGWKGSGMILTFALAQLLRRVPGNAHMHGGSGSHSGLAPPH